MADVQKSPVAQKGGIYALKTTINQEKTVAQMLTGKAMRNKTGILAILSPAELRGYVLVEAAGIAEGDIVELIAGPFKGEKARVQRIDESKEEITVELFEAMVPIPVTVRGDNVRVLQKKPGQ